MPLSKKELLRDNVKLIEHLRQCTASNIELKILHEAMLKEVTATNKKIDKLRGNE